MGREEFISDTSDSHAVQDEDDDMAHLEEQMLMLLRRRRELEEQWEHLCGTVHEREMERDALLYGEVLAKKTTGSEAPTKKKKEHIKWSLLKNHVHHQHEEQLHQHHDLVELHRRLQSDLVAARAEVARARQHADRRRQARLALEAEAQELQQAKEQAIMAALQIQDEFKEMSQLVEDLRNAGGAGHYLDEMIESKMSIVSGRGSLGLEMAPHDDDDDDGEAPPPMIFGFNSCTESLSMQLELGHVSDGEGSNDELDTIMRKVSTSSDRIETLRKSFSNGSLTSLDKGPHLGKRGHISTVANEELEQQNFTQSLPSRPRRSRQVSRKSVTATTSPGSMQARLSKRESLGMVLGASDVPCKPSAARSKRESLAMAGSCMEHLAPECRSKKAAGVAAERTLDLEIVSEAKPAKTIAEDHCPKVDAARLVQTSIEVEAAQAEKLQAQQTALNSDMSKIQERLLEARSQLQELDKLCAAAAVAAAARQAAAERRRRPSHECDQDDLLGGLVMGFSGKAAADSRQRARLRKDKLKLQAWAEEAQRMIVVGAGIKVLRTITYRLPADPSKHYRLASGMRGVIVQIDSEGDAEVRWEGLGKKWLLRKDFYKVTVETLPPGTRRPQAKPRRGSFAKGQRTNPVTNPNKLPEPVTTIFVSSAGNSSDGEPVAELGAEVLPWQRPGSAPEVMAKLTNSTVCSSDVSSMSTRGTSIGSDRSAPRSPTELYFQAGREYEVLPVPEGEEQRLALRTAANEEAEEVGQLEEGAQVTLVEVGTSCIRVFYKAKGLKGWIAPLSKDGTLLLRRLEALPCPEGHALQFTQGKHGKCAQCLKRFRRGAPVMECERCRWYLCEVCHPQEEKAVVVQNHAYRFQALAPP